MFKSVILAASLLAVAIPATASTIAWTQGSDGDDWTQSFSAVNANTISFAGTADYYFGGGNGGPAAHSHGQAMTWFINLVVNGVETNVFSETLTSSNFTLLSSLGTVGFAGGSVTALHLTCSNCSQNTYHQFSDTTFTLDLANVVPEPASGALVAVGLLGMVGATLRRRAAPAA